jgi:hypothetical protein
MPDYVPLQNSTYYNPTAPAEAKQEERKEKGMVLSAMPLIEDMIKHLEERIHFYETVDSIPAEVRTDTRLFMLRVEANDLAKENLKSEKEYFEQLRDEYV